VASCAESLLTVPEESQAVVTPAKLTFHALYHAEFDHVVRLVLRFGIGAHDAEDLTQRVFLVAYRKQEELPHLERPQAWLRAIVIRVVREHFRWLKVRRAASWIVLNSWAGQVEEDVTPERDVLAQESLDRARSVLERMSEKLRETLVLLDIEGLSPKEAAELLGVPHNTLRSRRALAREEFKRLWHCEQRNRMARDD
jgi:RNA polymerase sigma-70 factor (ECF subfamily)